MNFKRVYFYLSSFTLVFFTILLVLFLNYFLIFEMKIIENSLFLILFLTLFGSLFFLLISSKILKPIFQSEENIKDSIFINSYFPHFVSENCSRLIHLSTDCVFNGKNGPYNEYSYKNGELKISMDYE